MLYVFASKTGGSVYQRRYVAAKFVLEKDPAGRFRFRLVSQGRVLASSESYTTKRAAQNAIASVKAGAGGATVDDTTQPAAPERSTGRKTAAAKKSTGVKSARNAGQSRPDIRSAQLVRNNSQCVLSASLRCEFATQPVPARRVRRYPDGWVFAGADSSVAGREAEIDECDPIMAGGDRKGMWRRYPDHVIRRQFRS